MNCPECNKDLIEGTYKGQYENVFMITKIYHCDKCHIRIEKTELT